MNPSKKIKMDVGTIQCVEEIYENSSIPEETKRKKPLIDDQTSSFKSLLTSLPSEIEMDKKGSRIFPIQHYSDLIKVILSSEHASKFLKDLKEVLIYEDMSINIWKALNYALRDISENLTSAEVVNALSIINRIGNPESKARTEFGPPLFYCRLKEGVINDKEIDTSIKQLWNRLLGVKDLSLKHKQELLLVLYNQLMPRMIKPIFLLDYFMACLSLGGPISLLALEGIFTLVHKFNMNYPDVYKKLYSMLDHYVFDSIQCKSKFYELLDLFFTSSHLPEALVAGFIKKCARLSLTAPPTDIKIMMTIIINLMIRHPGLKILMNNITQVTSIKNDPYQIEEKDPALSCAIESSLWEVKLIQQHVLPSVSSSAMFIHNNLPSVECDLSVLLDTDDEMFEKELKKKMKNPPISFEKPVGLAVSTPKNGINLWCFNK